MTSHINIVQKAENHWFYKYVNVYFSKTKFSLENMIEDSERIFEFILKKASQWNII